MILLLALLAPAASDPALPVNDEIVRILAGKRQEADLPGMVAGIVRGGKLVGVGAAGIRKDGETIPITVDDRLHLGSNTKSMTATMIATLIEEGKLSWDTKLADLFPAESAKWHEDWRTVTLQQLLSHTAGLKSDVSYFFLRGKTTTEQRRAILGQEWWTNAPESKPGTRFRYSNLGYVLVGLMAETVTGKSWEELMRERVFSPLGMTKTGFGAPGARGQTDEPFGHILNNGKRSPSQLDNAACLGPAGTVHAPIADWAKFVIQHLEGERGAGAGTLLLKTATFRKLHTVVKDQYACGWLRPSKPGVRTPLLFHNGSNTFWYAEMWLDPDNDIAVLVATNQGGKEATRAVQAAAAALFVLAKEK